MLLAVTCLLLAQAAAPAPSPVPAAPSPSPAAVPPSKVTPKPAASPDTRPVCAARITDVPNLDPKMVAGTDHPLDARIAGSGLCKPPTPPSPGTDTAEKKK